MTQTQAQTRHYPESWARPPGMRLLFLCDWLPPDFGAVGQYTVLRARELAQAGHQVVVVGCSQVARESLQESWGSGTLRIDYVVRPPYDKQRLLQRSWWTLATNVRLLRACRRDYARADEVIFTGSPPYLLHLIALCNLWRRRTLVYRISDFHPECLAAEYTRVPVWLRLLGRLTWFWRRRIRQYEVLGHDQARHLMAGGIAPERIRLLRDPSPVHFGAETLPAARPPQLAGRICLLYSGNFGVAHDHTTLVAALTEIEARWPGRVGLWLNAVGSKADRVEQALQSAGVCVARTAPVPLAQLASVLLAADVHVVCLRDAFVGYVLPSKVYACIASGRAVLYIGSPSSDVHSLCLEAAVAYAQVDCGDVCAAVEALRELCKLA